MKGDSIPTPDFLMPLREGFFDPYPLDGEGPIEPPKNAKVWVNPGFSRKRAAWENAKRWAKEGRYVLCYLPVEGSTDQNGEAERLTPHRRPYEGCRDIELIILDGRKPAPSQEAPR